MTETRNKKRLGLSHNALQGLALVFMLIDHTWATIVSGNQWMTCVGRLAFPIFAFLITEGYAHTRDWKVYAKRLFWFGVISEIPFNLMIFSSPIFPFHQNVMFTLLLGLLSIHFWETALTEPTAGKQIKRLLECLACILVPGLWHDGRDYGADVLGDSQFAVPLGIPAGGHGSAECVCHGRYGNSDGSGQLAVRFPGAGLCRPGSGADLVV